MEITINEETISFTLEQERVLGDVVDGIQSWLATNGFALTEIKRDNSRLQMGERLEWQNDPIDDISRLDFKALHPIHIAFDKLLAIQQYLQLLEESDTPDSPVFVDLLKGIDDVAELLHEVFRPFGGAYATWGNRLLSFFPATDSEQRTLSRDVFPSFMDFVGDLKASVTESLREITEPASELRQSAEDLSASLQEIGDVAVLLQTGNDREALSHLVSFADLLQKVIRLVRYIGDQSIIDINSLRIEGETLIRFGSALNDLLNELTDAMEHGDTVLIGDILEYEIAPKLEALITVIGENGIA